MLCKKQIGYHFPPKKHIPTPTQALFLRRFQLPRCAPSKTPFSHPLAGSKDRGYSPISPPRVFRLLWLPLTRSRHFTVSRLRTWFTTLLLELFLDLLVNACQSEIGRCIVKKRRKKPSKLRMRVLDRIREGRVFESG